MKKLVYGVFAAVLFSSCGAYAPSPVTGFLFTDVKGNAMVTSNSLGSKVGSAEASSILGIIGTGDVSVQTIAKNANISKISHVDYHTKNILGIYATHTVFVYGQ